MNARRLVLAALCAVGGVLALSGASAMAVVSHQYLSQLTGFGDPTALTVGPAGDLYVVDSGDRVVDRFSSAGVPVAFSAVEPYVEGSRLTGTPAGAFGEPVGVAVDNSTGEIYVSDRARNVVDVFSSSGEYLSQLTGTPPSAPVSGAFTYLEGLAFDQSTQELYVSDYKHGVVDLFSASGTYVSQLNTGFGGTSVAVNELSGDAYVAFGDNLGVVKIFDAPGSFVPPEWSGASTPRGFFHNLGYGGEVYVGLDHSSNRLYVVNEAGFEASERAVYELNASGSEEYLGKVNGTPAGPFSRPQAVSVDPSSGDLYVADASGVVDVFGPDIVLPEVTTGAASSLELRGATLSGTVDPDEAGEAKCGFELSTGTAVGKVVPCEPEGVVNGDSPVAVTAVVKGLQPDTTYHYRLQASNANGTNPGEASQDQEFTTPGPRIESQSASSVTSGSVTLDATIDPNRASTTYYFQYGTSAAYGSNLPVPPGLNLGSGEGGLSVSVHLQGLEAGTLYHYRVVAVGGLGGETVTEEGSDQAFTTQVVGNEFTLPDGREWEMVTPPDKQGAGLFGLGFEQGALIQVAEDGGAITYAVFAPFEVNPAGSYNPEVTQVFSSRSAPGVWDTQDIATPHNEGGADLPLGDESEYKLFSSDLSLGIVEPNGHTPLPPLPAGAEKTIYLRKANGEYEALVSAANVPAGVKFGGSGKSRSSIHFAGADPDFSEVFIDSEVGLTAGTTGGLYVWRSGQLRYVGAYGIAGARGAISTDGSRVVLNGAGGLYLHDMVNGSTVRVGGGGYLAANSEGSRVFFSEDGALEVFEVTSGAGEPLAGEVTDLTVDENAGENAGMQSVLGASEEDSNGSYVYFAANGVLGDGAGRGAEPANCGYLLNALCNLYVVHYDEGTKTWTTPHFIAALSDADDPSFGGGPSRSLAELTSRVSPDGRYLAFMSERSLTGYENRDANSGVPDEEVFLYDAGTGRLVCASCNPTGTRPVGLHEGNIFANLNLVDFAQIWQERWFAANIPGWTTTTLGVALTQSPYLSNSGRLFFNADDALVPADVNGVEDVYEYEPAGVGSCQGPGYGQSASVVYSESVGGCVGLISAGTSPEESAFIGASETGGDVFFLTLSQLSSRDQDTSFDIYDAHECTVSSPCAASAALVPSPCATGDSCKPAPTPQPSTFGEPASETFSGNGNVATSVSSPAATPRSVARALSLARALRECRKKPRKRRAACESLARRRYGAKGSRAGKSLSTGTRR